MTEQEWKAQRNRAKANWELLQMKVRSGMVTPDAVAEAERAYRALADYRPESELKPPTTGHAQLTQPEGGSVELPAMPVSEFARLMEELSVEKAGYHKQMCQLCNQLKDVPDHESAKDLVVRIDHFYELRNEVGTKMGFLKANGRLPQPEGNAPVVDAEAMKLTFMENLPADKYELSRQLNLKLPNLSKARARLERAKDVATRQHYAQKVAQLETEVGLMRSALKGMD